MKFWVVHQRPAVTTTTNDLGFKEKQFSWLDYPKRGLGAAVVVEAEDQKEARVRCVRIGMDRSSGRWERARPEQAYERGSIRPPLFMKQDKDGFIYSVDERRCYIHWHDGTFVPAIGQHISVLRQLFDLLSKEK